MHAEKVYKKNSERLRVKSILKGAGKLPGLIYSLSGENENKRIQAKRYIYTRLVMLLNYLFFKRNLPQKVSVQQYIDESPAIREKISQIYCDDFKLYYAVKNNKNELLNTNDL
jgi:hypothetical protein